MKAQRKLGIGCG
jgi:hypothetical protein